MGFKSILSQDEQHNLMLKNMDNKHMVYTISYEAKPIFDDIKIIWKGISENAKKRKGLEPGKQFAFFIKDEDKQIKGGCSGYIFYGCLYVDLLWVDESLREKKYGTPEFDSSI